MKKRGSQALVWCMLVLVAAGALLPRMVSSLQDSKLLQQTQSRDLDGVELTLRSGGEIKQILPILTNGYSVIELKEGTTLTDAQPIDAAKEFLTLLSQELHQPSEFTLWQEDLYTSAYAFAAIPVSGAISSRVLWDCFLMHKSQWSCTMLIDDATGMMMSIMLQDESFSTAYAKAEDSVYQNDLNTSEKSKISLIEEIDQQAAGWAKFLQEYYGYDSVQVNASYLNEGTGIFDLEFTWTIDKTTMVQSFPLVIQEHSIVFNQ